MKNKQNKKPLVKIFAPALAIIVLAHLPLWALRPYASLPQAIFELDLLVGVIAFALNRWIGGAAILLGWSLSLLRCVAVNYHFHNVAEFLDAARFAGLISYSGFLSPMHIFALVLSIFVGYVIFRAMARTRAAPLPILAIVVLLATLDVLNGSGIVRGRDLPYASINVLGSPGYNLAISERNFWRDAKSALVPIQPVPRSYKALRAALDARQGSVMVILVESLGEPQVREIRDWLLGQLRIPALLRAWDLNDGSEAFFGGTVAGELRVLCGLQGHYSRLTQEQSIECLPRLFHAQGEASIAMHGFSSRMFDRSTWWPIAGFTETRFAEAWKDSPRCDGAFNAVCDHDLIVSAIQLAGERRQFVYALTINTHLPLPPLTVVPGLQTLCKTHNIPESACELVQAHGNFFADLAIQMANAPDVLREIVIVGDHSPPFNDYHARRVFSSNTVPSLILTRR